MCHAYLADTFMGCSHLFRMNDLKSRIVTSGLEVYDQYPCRWGGVADGKPMVAGLEELGQRVLSNLWNTIELNHVHEVHTLSATAQ